jgi:predicted dinucleotide-binding enzyme
MPDIKTIAIIEATSEMGSAIARSLSKSSKHRLLLMSDDHSTLEELRKEIGAYKSGNDVFTMSCAREASWEADIIIIAEETCSNDKTVADKIRDVAIGKIVIRTSNQILDCFHRHVECGTSAAEELQKLLPHSKVVKAFYTMFPSDVTSRATNGKSVDVIIAGNDRAAVETTSEVVTRAGFSSMVLGDLTVSRELGQIRVKLIQHELREYNWLGVGRHFYT